MEEMGDENPSAKLPVLGSLNSTSFNSRFFSSLCPLRENKSFNIPAVLQEGSRKINNSDLKMSSGENN